MPNRQPTGPSVAKSEAQISALNSLWSDVSVVGGAIRGHRLHSYLGIRLSTIAMQNVTTGIEMGASGNISPMQDTVTETFRLHEKIT